MESYGTSHHGDGKQSAEMLELRTEIEKVKANLYDIEQQIFQEEELYIDETPNGNIVRGWEGFLDGKPPPKRRLEGRDRVFSWSSYTYWKDHVESMLENANVEEPLGPPKRNRTSSSNHSPRDPAKKKRRKKSSINEPMSDDETSFFFK